MVARRLGFVLTVAAFGTGCALVSGLSNLDVGGSDSAAPLDGGATGDAAVDADSSSPPPFDAGEAGCGCGLNVPQGFSPILFADGKDKDDCPSGVVEEKIVVGPLTVPATPQCTCGCSLGGCTNVNVELHSGWGCSSLLATRGANGACVGAANLPAGSVRIAPVSIGGGVTCASTSTFPKPYGSNGALCTPSSCTILCAPPNEYPVCFVAQGDVSCPSIAPTRYVIAKSVTDTRTCAGCACVVGPNPACNVNLQWYSDSACTITTGLAQSIGSTCAPTTPSSHLKITATPAGTCTGGSGQGSGTTTPTNVRTVCCK